MADAGESVKGTARKQFIASLISIALLPASGWIGYYLAKYFAAPHLSIISLTIDVTTQSRLMNEAVFTKIRQNANLIARIQDFLAGPLLDPDYTCRRWLDGGPWHDKCLPAVEDMSIYLRNSAAAQLQWEPASKFAPAVKQMRVDVETLIGELKRLRAAAPGPRTGAVNLVAGVLNSGDSDGVVDRNAKVIFLGKTELPMIADRYTVIKAHSIAEITFSVDRPRATAGALEAWETLVRKGAPEGFSLRLNDGRLSMEDRLPQG